MERTRIRIWCIAVVTALGAGPAFVKAQVGSSFTYQGQLKDAGGAAEGDYDFLFRLYDDPNTGVQIGDDVSADNLTVSNGLFTTQLDFGAGAFTGDARWLEVAVRPGASVDPHTTLSPRQPLTPAPYALYALDGAGGGSLWIADPNNGISYQSGNVGIGTSSIPNISLLVDSAEIYTVTARNRSTSGNTFAVLAEGDSTSARAVFGLATATSGDTVGVFGRSQSPDGYGVWGHNNSDATTSKPIGVYGSADSARGVGVKGYVAGTQGVGIWARADGSSSHAMMAEATAISGTTFGLEAYATSPDGYGVYSFNEADTGDAIAIYGETGSPSGIGVKGATWAPDGYAVYGLNGASTGDAIGGYFKTDSTQGRGVYAEAVSASSGYAGYFVGRGYFSSNVGIGIASPGSPLTVAGLVESTTGGFKFPDGTIQTTAVNGASLWQQNGDEIYYDMDNVGVGVSDPQSTLHVAGGNWDVASTEGDFKIGDSVYRLKMGVALAGGGAGECRIFAGGPSSELILGANGQDRLTVTSTRVDVSGTLETDGLQLTTAPTSGHVLTCDGSGNGTWQEPTGGLALPYEGTIAIEEPAFKIINTDTSDETLSRAGHFECAGRFGEAVYAKTTGTFSTGVYADVSGSEATAVTAKATNGRGLVAHGNYAAGEFYGNVVIYEYGTEDEVIELGKGLDYAEGFDVTDSDEVEPGTVLVLDSRHAGQLVMSTQAYDRKVAGIVAGAKGLGSGVRLGGEFDHDVALAGRVYCSVVAAGEPIEIGDLLTTSDVPGHAMKVKDHQRAQGAILGKAMESLAAGERGQILVLVTLQ